MSGTGEVFLVSVGNTRTRCAGVVDGVPRDAVSVGSDEADEIAALAMSAIEADGESTILIASVNDPAAQRAEQRLAAVVPGARVLRFGRDLKVPIDHAHTGPVAIGQDRLLNALGAFTTARQACIVIDAGTAVTVDFVDGHGVLHGGVIAPGVRMMRAALHEKTAALPLIEGEVRLKREGEEEDGGGAPFGRSTEEAIRLGTCAAVQGLCRLLIDRYAEFYNAYPRVIATGGDAEALFGDDPVIETIAPDLTLSGMAAAWRLEVEAEGE